MKLVKLNGIWKKIVPSYTVTGRELSGTTQAFAGATDKIPDGWLLCNGAEYNVSDYTNLYNVIGNTYGGTAGSTFRVPDYRECVLVGAGQNGTDAVVTHDVYNVGQFKNDQLQQMTGYAGTWVRNLEASIYGVLNKWNDSAAQNYYGYSGGSPVAAVSFNSAYVARSGTTTHGKQKGVNYIIHI